MGQNYIRAATVTADSSTWELQAPPTPTLRMRFAVRQFNKDFVNQATVRITNPDPSKVTPLKSWVGKNLSISAGYMGDGPGLLFSGDISQATYGRENQTDTVLTIYAGDTRRAHNYAVVKQTLGPGSTPKDAVDAGVAAASALSPVTGPIVGASVDLSQPVYPRARTLFGQASEVFADIARSKQANASYQNGVLHIMGRDDVVSTNAIAMNTQTGMIGMPTQTVSGIMVRCFINPSIKINTLIQINQGDITEGQLAIDAGGSTAGSTDAMPKINMTDGVYKVLQIDVHADSRANGPWYMDLSCLSAPAGVLQAGSRVPDNLSLAASPEIPTT